ncbi:hypothetical protein KEF85_02190 [Methylomonas paludis]|uniref:Uncharacterized protein n=1 Tax=Methylomonas paludis TaxID=1173101 RepID=A0A975MPC3_9GAMM|nr:hypothetical protein [Methylomonas paludis]QWF71325.1 hypothetical protein KEF85_02190 [Methylomonas paludis]
MPGRLVYSILAIATAAMLLFLSGFVCFKLGLSSLASSFNWLADLTMLLAFTLLLLLGVAALFAGIGRELRAYFCQEAVALRKVLATHSQKIQLAQRKIPETSQIRYFSRLKRQRLLLADNRRQMRTLYRSIDQELQMAKPRLSAQRYKDLHKALRQHHKQADAQAMLALREQIS